MKTEKKTYEDVIVKIIVFSAQDVVRTSGTNPDIFDDDWADGNAQ